MEVKEEKLTEAQQVTEKTIPVFTVLKNGAILKNIFVVNSRDFSSPERNGDDDGEVEEILIVGRHPDCHIQLTHPSISRSHLEIRTIPSRQKLFVTDLSSVHGTWVTDQKVEPGVCVKVKEGDVIRIGGSTRIYRLHWIPLSRAYDIDNPFVSPLDASTAIEQEAENRTLEEEIAHQSLVKAASGDDDDLHLDVTSEGSGSSVPSEDEDTYIRTEEISFSPASPIVLALASHCVQTQKLQFNEDLQTLSEWDLDVVEAAAEKPSSIYSPSKQQSGGYPEVLGCSELEVAAEADACDVRVDLHLDMMSERMESAVPNVDEDPYLAAKEASSLPLPRDSIEMENRQLTEDVQVSQELDLSIIEANAENLSSWCFPSKGQIDGCIEALGCFAFELAAEVEIPLTEFATKQVMEASEISVTKDVTQNHEDNGESEVSRQIIAISPNFFPQTEPTFGILTEDVGGLGSELQSEVALVTDSENPQTEPTLEFSTEDVEGLGSELQSEVALVTDSENPEPTLEILIEDIEGLGSELQSDVALETYSENLHQESNGEGNVGSGQASAVCLSRITTEDIQSLCSSWQILPESDVRAPSEIWNEGKPAGDHIQKSRMTGETEIIFDEGSSSCLADDFHQSGFLLTPNKEPKTDMSIGSGISEESYSLSDIGGEVNSDMGSPMRSIFGVGNSDMGSPMPSTFEDTKPIEELPTDYTGGQENQTPQTHAVRDDVLTEIDSSTSSSRTLSTCNIWSRRGKDASVLQIRTNRSEGKRKQIGKQPKGQLQRKQALSDKSISLTPEPEIFTPDKENLTPSSHMLKRLQDIGDIKDSKGKSSSKLSVRSSSSKIPSIIDLVASEAFTEPEIFTPDKENLTPSSHMLKRLREVSEIKETKGSSSKATRKPFFDILSEENVQEKQKPDLNSMSSKSKVKHDAVTLKNKIERAPFQPLLEKSSSQSQSYMEVSSTASAINNNSTGIRSSSLLSDGTSKIKWTIVLDTSSLLDKDTRKPLHLLQGLKGTHLVVPRTVLRELNETKRTRSLLYRRRTEIASSALDWIEDCMVNTKWWIQIQTSSEETKANAPTPPVTPQSNVSAAFPFSLHWNSYAPEIDSPTSQDQVLECARLYRNINSHEKLVLISNDTTFKIKAMAEGVICETAHEFYESLVNPFSDRFMWRESTVRGRTWSHLDDVVLRERYNNRTCFPYRKKSMFNNGVKSGAAAKGLKLILLHNSHYGHNHQ
ncbi:hypothetical protein AALP_AA1G348700 [Arabis alpina]|uniref:FHA domain-containing protein n=1 Tax=Arabis alpina TaxID=50452 RepID=A0A087HSN6_ARAAL|nr:hypothetical protein AALP_AA1G348700 [Arabis alpina]